MAQQITKVVLYRWPDGWSVVRMAPAGTENAAVFSLVDPSGESASILWVDAEIRQNTDPDYHTRVGHPFILENPDKDAAIELRWLQFGLDLIITPDDDIQGRWGVMKLPLWLPSSVFVRMRDTDREGRVQQLNAECEHLMSFGETWWENPEWDEVTKASEAAYAAVLEFVKYVFKGFESFRVDNMDWIVLGDRERQRISPLYSDGRWHLIGPDGHTVSRGATLAQAIQEGRFAEEGPWLDEEMAEDWHVEIEVPDGAPTVDLDLEPYTLMDLASPMIWPWARFTAWWASATSS